MTGKLRYRLLTGPDDKSFCERVSKALDEGYELYGSPAVTYQRRARHRRPGARTEERRAAAHRIATPDPVEISDPAITPAF
jgi:hypothetical protein